jgi:hypothetical protein
MSKKKRKLFCGLLKREKLKTQKNKFLKKQSRCKSAHRIYIYQTAKNSTKMKKGQFLSLLVKMV